MSNLATERELRKQDLEDIVLPEDEGAISQRSLVSESEKHQERFLNDLEMTDADKEERKLKTGSLKRFFRKNPKKSSESYGADIKGDRRKPHQAIEQNPTGDDEMAKNAKESDDVHQDTYSKSFQYRLGGMYRYSTSSNIDSKMNLNDSASKVTLKSSLSTYWNSVFKKKKSKSSHEVGQQHAEVMMGVATANNYSESALQSPQRGNLLVEDIHALKISDDPNGGN